MPLLTPQRLQWIYILFATAFLGLQSVGHFSAAAIPKAVPALAFALIFFREHGLSEARIMGSGFAFSALGDVLLHLDREAYFVFGLASFLAAHLCYATFFFRHRRPTPGRWALAAIPVLAAAGLGAVLFPRLGALTI